MDTKEEILTLVDKYCEEFAHARQQSQPLVEFVRAHEGDALINRKNLSGHITSSAFIVNESVDKLLLLKHTFLNRWLQPGGHVDADDASLQASALREAIEETGLFAESLRLVSKEIFDVNSHQIPANEKKKEPAHIHHDVRFLYECFNADSLDISKEESTDGRWFSFTELANNPDFYWVEEKVKAFLQKKLF